MATRTYTDEEVDAILKRAIERQHAQADGLGHEELVAAAKEIGLDEAAVARAVDEVELEQGERSLVAEVKAKKRGRFLRHLFVYATIIAGLLGLHFVGLAGAWVFWVVFGWGAGVLLSAPRAFREPSEQELEDLSRKKNRRERRRLQAEARAAERERQRQRREARRRGEKSPVEAEMERVVEEGVAALLRVAAAKLADAGKPPAPRPGQGDFGTYVAKKEGTAPPPAAAPPKVRVAEAEVVPDAEADESARARLKAPTSRRDRS